MATTTGTGPPPVVTAAAPAPPPSRHRLRLSLLTTPGRLRALSVCVVVGIALAWVADVGVVSRRHHALSSFGGQSEPLVVLAQRLQTELSEADASAANGFLAGALEPADQVSRYQQGITQAGADVAQAARDAGTGGASGVAVRTLAEQLPVYTGLVETAVADNRQGFPVGAAYLRSASQLLHTEMLPAAARLPAVRAAEANRQEDAATAFSDVMLVAAGTAVALIALIAFQVYLERRTRRLFNPGLLVATVAMVVLVVVMLGALGSQRAKVVTGTEHDYGPAARVAQVRVLAFQADGDESEALIARGTGQAFLADADAAVAAARQDQAAATSEAGASGSTAALDRAAVDLQAFVAVDATIRADDANGQHDQAVALALTSAPTGSNAALQALDGELTTALDAEQASFAAGLAQARHAIASLTAIATVAAAAAVVAALIGVKPRIDEYR